ncbi:cilia- and flagella-associated protein 20 [Bombina bombina]|uniref:cilia- and flagella-associated protein 20 n=1 Tax=Bombina bombina TaxID=8345 RepID=UPI00235AAF1F|nr:cilia- and flagella-associated protein 20 [Bombina bombina]
MTLIVIIYKSAIQPSIQNTRLTLGHNQVRRLTLGHNQVMCLTLGHNQVTLLTLGHNQVMRLTLGHNQVRNGHIKRITDNDIQSLVLEVEGTNVSTTYITCPADPKKTLGIKLPFLVMIIKNLKKYFTFEVQVLDDKNVRRRFRASNYQSTTRVKPFICTMPMRLDDGWNQIQFNLSDFTRRAYGTNYIETLRVQIHANCRIRRVYFSDRLYSEDELPAEFKLYLPVQNKAKQ